MKIVYKRENYLHRGWLNLRNKWYLPRGLKTRKITEVVGFKLET